ncbi:MAG: hypothetical protein LBT76_00595 [Tannerella sp.]|jgi:alpha-mannosidase|nr:hypothetical protein [Tannerella sp.]
MKANSISRRGFIRRSVTGTVWLALTPANSLLANPTAGAWPANARKHTFHLVGQTHIDPVWLWTWQEGVGVIHSTFRSALDRMNENPAIVFSCTSAQFYQWVAENDPAMMSEIRQRVGEGRWNLIGGWWVEPDMNLPSGEAMARQGLYGQRTFEQLLGRRATVGYCDDSFGHAGTVPQILRLQGIENYVFSRPGSNEKALPSNLFWWEAPDGSRVLAFRRAGAVGGSDGNAAEFRQRLEALLAGAGDHPVPDFIVWYGIGDHGGGPTKANIRAIEEVKAEKGAPRIFYSSEDRYFKELRAGSDLRHLPVVKDDLQHHAVGCYTSEWEIKKNNRLSETALVTAEKIAAIGAAAWHVAYPKTAFTQAWHKLLFLQFHDSLAGSSIAEHSRQARDGFGHVMDVARDAMYKALQKLEWQIPADDPCGQYSIVFNPHAWAVRQVIEIPCSRWPPTGCEHKPETAVAVVCDDLGQPLPHQWAVGQSQTANYKETLLVEVSLPPAGYRQIKAANAGAGHAFRHVAQAEGRCLENEYYRITFAGTGAVDIFDRRVGRPVFAGDGGGCRAIVVEDPYDTWGHNAGSFDLREKCVFDHAAVSVTERGPLRATVRTESVCGQSTLAVDWSLVAGSCEIEARVTLDWHEHQKMLRFSFPVDVDAPAATFETPYGFIVRGTGGHEEPGQRWIDLTGRRGDSRYGLTVINDAKYGYSVRGNDLRISIARSTVFAHHEPVQLDPGKAYTWMDQGIQTFRLLLAPHTDGWRDIRAPRMAEQFMAPPLFVYQGIHRGNLPASGSFLAADAPNIVASAVKQSEDGDDLIVRLVETFGEAVETAVRFPFSGLEWQGAFRPCEIKTLRLNLSTKAVREVNLLEEPV